jgi:iron complex outermembrane recepter protein
MLRSVCVALMSLGVWPSVVSAQTVAAVTPQDLKRLSIEELAELDVTSVSRRAERLAETAAAISVIRNDDLRRIGVVTMPEAMRLTAGVDVGRFDGRTWAISARGFNITTANKLLVLVDGRTVYSPLFSGTFWDVQDTFFGDVDRIEVIRGPGGTMWGANAVNGVVNIITRPASQTRGTAASLSAGTEERLVASARHGGRLGADGSYRVYGKFRTRDANIFEGGADSGDEMRFGQTGFRIDSGGSRAVAWTVQGDLYVGTEGLFNRGDTDVSGGNVMGHWTRRFGGASEFRLLTYYDRSHRRVPLQFQETRDTFELDLQHRTTFLRRHEVVAGGGFRVTTGDAIGSVAFVFDPVGRTDTLFNFFAQDEIAIRPGRVFLTLGSKLERNDFTGFEVQPTARVRWTRRDRQTLWGAVSRAVRLPTRFDTDLRLFTPAGALFLSGDPAFESESVVAYEGGYRVRPLARLSLDFAAFANRYDNLRSQELPSRLGNVILLGNTLNAVTSGVEAAATAQVLDPWRVHASFSYLHKNLTLDAGSRDISRGVPEGNDPDFMFTMRSYLDLPRGFAFDGSFRYVSERPGPVVPDYGELDLRLGWAARSGLEISIVGRNLLHSHHPEFRSLSAPRYEFERGIDLRSTWRF